MRRLLTLSLAMGIVAVFAGACSLGEEDPTYTLPSAPTAVALVTQPASSTSACSLNTLTSVTVQWDATHRTLSLGGEKVTFPAGFSARELTTGRLEILAPDGSIVARDGDVLMLGGSDYMHVCRVQMVEY